MIPKLIVALAAFLPVTLHAQTAPPAEPARDLPAGTAWVHTADDYASVPARIAFPRRAGAISVVDARDARQQRDGMDSMLSYASSDQRIIGTVYVYHPGLAHSGLAAYATDRGLHANSQTPLEATPMRVVDAGGVTGAAIRIDYRNYRGENASSAAFIKAGRWLVKVRLTGPEASRAEVMQAMDSILSDMRFGAQNPARPAAPIAVADCPAGSGQRDATLLPDPPQQELGAYGFLALLDGAGIVATDERSGGPSVLPARVPSSLCVSSRLGNGMIPILRDPGGSIEAVDGRTRLVVILSDAGTLLEIVEAPRLGRHVMLHHEIGATRVLGSYDSAPSDRQIEAMLSGRAGEATRVRVPVTFRPDGQTEMHLPALPAEAERPGT